MNDYLIKPKEFIELPEDGAVETLPKNEEEVVPFSRESLALARQQSIELKSQDEAMRLVYEAAEDAFIEDYLNTGSIAKSANKLKIKGIYESRQSLLKKAVSIVSSASVARLIAEKRGLTIMAEVDAIADALKADKVVLNKEGDIVNLGPDHKIRVLAAREARELRNTATPKIVEKIENNLYKTDVENLTQVFS